MRNRGMLTAGVALVLGVPVAAWGLMGQQNHDGLPASELDYAYQPWGIGDGVAAGVGGLALVLAGVGAAVLVRGAMDRRWWGVLGPLVVVGLMVGVGWRVLTAGVVGANIGAGMLIIFGTPVAAGLLLWAVGRGVWLATRGHGGGSGGAGRLGGVSPRGV
ncbi:hypothetical protein KJK29_21770 [Streptomyces koelreuteriae]|uniref:Uncharacterized protein n=1 Tax=Streptomyces koelreuteriae TaxID=2838015 RepID=A0ABX8FV97_9ACTN|nr:hypothetical protein [Streptomyces koelreuteriae]QWB24993.1 hypothetical protein KJK29_21770 [Streptomyces koelreuteriae]UUA08018.1 hypothetical protein NNW98_21905 [Streptomyces koelreuteriae]